jgi:hypothetical protein
MQIFKRKTKQLVATMATVAGTFIGVACSSKTPPASPQEELTRELAPSRVASPFEHWGIALGQVTPQPTRTRTEVLSDVVAASADNAQPIAPAVQALRSAGWTDDEIASMITVAAAYNSGQPSDPLAARQSVLRQSVNDGLVQLDRAITMFEIDNATTIDRSGLLQAAYNLPQLQAVVQ